MTVTPIIDAHHHLWRYTPEEFSWLDDSMAALRRDYLAPDLLAMTESAGVIGTVAVQARQTVAETRFLLDIARETPSILGVVGWLPLAGPGLPELLEQFAGEKKLKGLRHVLQAEPDQYMLADGFNEGIRALRGTGLVYDVLIFEQQLPAAMEFIDRHPDQVFVLDHVAKPRIKAAQINGTHTLEPWASGIRELARRDNVFCKVSGMVTEADWSMWTPLTLRPYLDVVLESFGPGRLLAGSDWPVCLVASTYCGWFDVLRTYFADLTESEQTAVFSGNAASVYRL